MAKKETKAKTVAAPVVARQKNSVKSVNTKVSNAIRRDNRETPSLSLLRQRIRQRQELMTMKSNDPKVQAARKKIYEQERVERDAHELFTKYSGDGATYAACVQAVKTGYVPSFIAKYRSKADVPAEETVAA